MPWFSIRAVYMHERQSDGPGICEQRIVLFRASDAEHACALAENESRDYLQLNPTFQRVGEWIEFAIGLDGEELMDQRPGADFRVPIWRRKSITNAGTLISSFSPMETKSRPANRRCSRRAARNNRNLQTGNNHVLYDQFSADRMRMRVGFPVSKPFADTLQVKCVELSGERTADMTHPGSYRGLPAAHIRVNEWSTEHSLQPAGASWEVYGDWCQDESRLVTEIHIRLT